MINQIGKKRRLIHKSLWNFCDVHIIFIVVVPNSRWIDLWFNFDLFDIIIIIIVVFSFLFFFSLSKKKFNWIDELQFVIIEYNNDSIDTINQSIKLKTEIELNSIFLNKKNQYRWPDETEQLILVNKKKKFNSRWTMHLYIMISNLSL